MDTKNLKDKLIQISSILGKEIPFDSLQIFDRGIPHQATSLPAGKMAIYIFVYKNQCFKIGKVSTNSNARFQSQHYCPKSSNSNLAKSILQDRDFCESNFICEDKIKKWMLENLNRIDILIDESLGILTLGFIEGCLQYSYQPKYEGFKTQRGSSPELV